MQIFSHWSGKFEGFSNSYFFDTYNVFEKALYIRYTQISLVPVTFIFRVAWRV